MKHIDQTKLLERDGVGDCCRSAIASLLEEDLENIPEFEYLKEEQQLAVVTFMESKGYQYRGCYTAEEFLDLAHLFNNGIGGYFLASGGSPRSKDHGHAIIVNKQCDIVHDPHPSRDGIVGTMYITIFEPTDTTND